MLTIDANIWISAVTPTEKEFQVSREFLMKVSTAGISVVVPTLLRVELAATFGRTAATANAVIGLTRMLASISSIAWISLDRPLAETAARIAIQHQLRGADAVYAAVAFESGCKLISMDREHLERLPPLIEVLTPAAALAKISSDAL